MSNLAKAYTRARWLEQRWRLRSFEGHRCAALGDDPDAVVEWVFTAHHGALAPFQSKTELIEFASLVKAREPRYVLELGTARGGTLIVLSRMAADDATIVSVDLPAGIGGGGYPTWKKPILESFTKNGQTLHLLRVDSHLESTFSRVREAIGGQQLDLLFIDGDHSYDGALRDFSMYSKLVRPGGLICFHDIVPNPGNEAIETPRVWDEVSTGRQTSVIRDTAGLPRFGIGIITA